MRIAPRTVVPASAGFRFFWSHEWLNAFRFPMSLGAYASHRAACRVDVVFPDDHVCCYRFDFGDEQPHATDGSGAGPPSDLVHRKPASALTGWSRHARSFFSVRASSRRTVRCTVQSVTATPCARSRVRCPICSCTTSSGRRTARSSPPNTRSTTGSSCCGTGTSRGVAGCS
jgi:hypothetical protein